MTMSTDSPRPTIEFLVRPESSQLGFAYTRGLWRLGIPELVITMPAESPVHQTPGQAQLANVLARGLVELSRRLIAADDFSVPAFHEEFAGRPVRIWLGRPQPVEGVLLIALGEEVDTHLPVHVSLWDDDPAPG
jgi:hypothetical protein